VEHGIGFGARSGRTRLGKAAEANLEACATVAAAGIVAEGAPRARFWEVSPDAPWSSDIGQLARMAARLGVIRRTEGYYARRGMESTDDPAFGPWAMAAVRRARTRLRRDGGAAWRRVTAALLREHRVSGAAVYMLALPRRGPTRAQSPDQPSTQARAAGRE